MYIDKRIDRQGLVYYSFSYDDPTTKKRIRLKREEHPLFRDEQSAREWALSQDAQRSARLAAIAKREAWKTTYYDLEALVERYREHSKTIQPRSYKMFLGYFERVALRFFLGDRQASNPNNWYLMFPEFRDWLQVITTRGGKPLAVTTRNHVIVSVNNFIAYLGERGLIAAESNVKCGLFSTANVEKKTADDCLTKEEFAHIEARLRDANPEAADFFTVLYNTGMRFNELLGTSMDMLHAGKVNNATLSDELESKNLNEYFGYIFLYSQPKTKAKIRDEKGHIERAPLKGRKTTTPKDARTIPIFDKKCWNILARRHAEQEKLLEKRPYGTDEADYLLFSETFTSTFSNIVSRAYVGTSYSTKSPHDLRHTYCTDLVGRTRSLFLARLILGHRTERVLEGYLHVYDQINRSAQKATRKITVVD